MNRGSGGCPLERCEGPKARAATGRQRCGGECAGGGCLQNALFCGVARTRRIQTGHRAPPLAAFNVAVAGADPKGRLPPPAPSQRSAVARFSFGTPSRSPPPPPVPTPASERHLCSYIGTAFLPLHSLPADSPWTHRGPWGCVRSRPAWVDPYAVARSHTYAPPLRHRGRILTGGCVLYVHTILAHGPLLPLLSFLNRGMDL